MLYKGSLALSLSQLWTNPCGIFSPWALDGVKKAVSWFSMVRERFWVISECSSYKISNTPCHTLPFALPYIAIALPQWGYNTGIWIHSDCNQLNRNSQLLEFRREFLTRNERFFWESARSQKIAIEIKILKLLRFCLIISLYVVSIIGSSQELGIWCLQKKWADIAWVYKVIHNVEVLTI